MGDTRAVRWLDGTDARPLVLQFADDHHAFHEDAKPGDLTGQLGTRDLLPRLMKQVRESVSKRVASATRPSLALRLQVFLEVAADSLPKVRPSRSAGVSTKKVVLLGQHKQVVGFARLDERLHYFNG